MSSYTPKQPKEGEVAANFRHQSKERSFDQALGLCYWQSSGVKGRVRCIHACTSFYW